MTETIESRIERLLDQLETPGLTSQEIERIKEKIEYLESRE